MSFRAESAERRIPDPFASIAASAANFSRRPILAGTSTARKNHNQIRAVAFRLRQHSRGRREVIRRRLEPRLRRRRILADRSQIARRYMPVATGPERMKRNLRISRRRQSRAETRIVRSEERIDPIELAKEPPRTAPTISENNSPTSRASIECARATTLLPATSRASSNRAISSIDAPGCRREIAASAGIKHIRSPSAPGKITSTRLIARVLFSADFIGREPITPSLCHSERSEESRIRMRAQWPPIF